MRPDEKYLYAHSVLVLVGVDRRMPFHVLISLEFAGHSPVEY